MRILDENDVEITEPDFALGWVTPDSIFVMHHDAVPEVQEQFHYEVVKRYKNGGKDVRKVIDVPGQEAVPAWDEYEDILRWHWSEAPQKTPAYEMIAADNIVKDDYFFIGEDLYIATDTIPKGIRIRENANCIKMDLADGLQEANNGKTDL